MSTAYHLTLNEVYQYVCVPLFCNFSMWAELLEIAG